MSNSPTKKSKHSIESWAKSIPANAKPASRATRSRQANTVRPGKPSAGRSASVIPSLINASSHSTGVSLLTDIVAVTRAQVSPVRIKPDPNSFLIQWHDLGGLSDHDETNGCEREAALAAPFKGRKRLTSEALVRIVEKKPKTGEPSKKPKNGDLPNGIDYKIWHQVFVPTFTKWVSQQDSPFEHNPKLACEVMQKIWDALFDEVPHMVVQSSPVYALTVQQVSDSWRNTIGSTAIAIVLAFCNSIPDLKDSDEARQEFATSYLEHLRFLYDESDGDDPEKFTGVFRGAFILQTFAAHLTAIKGARNLYPDKAPCGGLALCAAAVERALEFVAAGTITVEMVQKAKGKVPTLPKQINQATTKAPNHSTGFNETTWGARCRSYVKSTKRLTASRFEKIITLTTEYVRTPCTVGSTTVIEIDDDEDDIRANLVDRSSGSEPESDSD